MKEKDSNLVTELLFRYGPYRYLFLLILVLALCGSVLYLFVTTSYYEATARLLIKDDSRGAGLAKGNAGVDVLSSKTIVENEIEVIGSATLLRKVVDSLKLYAQVSEKGVVGRSISYLSAPVSVEASDPNKIQNSGFIPLRFNSPANAVILAGISYPINKWVTTAFGSLRFLSNGNVRLKNDQTWFLQLQSPKQVTARLHDNLSLQSSGKQSSIIKLSLTDEVPERAVDILNALLKVYDQRSLEERNQTAANIVTFIDVQLKSIKQDLERIEKAKQQYQSSSNAFNLGQQATIVLQKVGATDQKVSQIQMQLAVLNQLASTVKGTRIGQEMPSTLGVTDGVLSQLLNRLSSVQLEYVQLSNTKGENNPEMLALSDRGKMIRANIEENINSQRKVLESSLNSLRQTNDMYASELKALPLKEQNLLNITREQSVKTSLYQSLLQKKEQVSIAKVANRSENRVIDSAESSGYPIYPKKKLVFVSALLLAVMASIVIVTLKESVSQRILFRHEIEKRTSRPIVGEVVSDRSLNPIVIGPARKTFIAEQFRKIRSSLKYIGIDLSHKRILVTSSIPGEGKSFVATNLALSLALAGRKVILVDCDLNNPSLVHKLKINDDRGVTEYLQHQCEVQDVIRQTDLHENLFFASTGRLPGNPSELLSNGRIEELFEHLDGLFDYIIVDTPPVGPVSDALLLSPLCDATLFVIRHRVTPKKMVEGIDGSDLNKFTNLFIVFNGVKSRGFGSKNFGYGYGYGYLHQDFKTPIGKPIV